MPETRSETRGAVTPRISVVTPFHERRHLLPELLATLEAQSFRDFELVIADDGSTDGLEEAVAEARSSFPIRFVRLPRNRGAATARNAGIDAASGQYVALLDSDDAWHAEKLERQLRHLDGNAANLVSLTRQKVIGATVHVSPARLMRREDSVGPYLFLHGGVIQSSMMMLDRELAARVRFEDGSRGHDDWSFALRLEQQGAQFEMLEEPLTLYNDGGERPRRSPSYSTERLAWLGQRRAQLGDAAYWAAVAAVASHLRAEKQVQPLKLIATALRNRAIGPSRAAYYMLAWAFPPARSFARRARHWTGGRQ